MNKLFTVVFAASLASSAAAAQVTTVQTANPAPKGTSQDLDKVVCETFETTGTRLGARRVCKTVADWLDQRRQHREGLEMVQRMATSTGCPNGAATC